MGYALAEAALARGHGVVLVSGPTELRPPSGADVRSVTSALEMQAAVDDALTGCGVDVVLAVAAGYWTGPACDLSQSHGAWAGLFVAIAVTLGALVSEAIMRELAPAPSVGRTGRWAFLDRTIPAVYAAPVFFHYLNYFS